MALIVALSILVTLGGGCTAYAAYFADRGLPNVFISGESVRGLTSEQITDLVKERYRDVTVSVSVGDATKDYTLDELGVTLAADATAANVLSENASILDRFRAFFRDRNVPVEATLDEAAMEKATQELLASVTQVAQEPALSFNLETGAFESSAAVTGVTVDQAPLVEATRQAATSLKSVSVSLDTTEVQPSVTTEQAQALADQATAVLDAGLTIMGSDGTPYSPSREDKATWLSIDTAAGEVKADAEAVRAWVQKAADLAHTDVVNGERYVRPDGSEIRVNSQGVRGQTVNNVDQLATDLVASLNGKTEFYGEFTYDVVEPTIVDVVKDIAPGAENLVYLATKGERWLDLNLGNNSVTMYEGSTVVGGPYWIVPGAPGMDTPTGTYKVYLKYDVQTMRGTNPDGTTYVAPGIQWVSYFTGSIAFHAAPWQSHFGWSGPGGSHGCVNMSTTDAKSLYDFAAVGTTVVSHY